MAGNPEGAAPGKPKVLVVDDEPAIRRMLVNLLKGSCEVFAAQDGPEALAILEKEGPALMLVDIAMPGMDGIEVLQAARKLDPRVTVSMLTGQNDIELARKAMDLGAAEYITKPFDVEVLRAEVGRLLRAAAPGGVEPYRPWRRGS